MVALAHLDNHQLDEAGAMPRDCSKATRTPEFLILQATYSKSGKTSKAPSACSPAD
jgi:hypothetical protein